MKILQVRKKLPGVSLVIFTIIFIQSATEAFQSIQYSISNAGETSNAIYDFIPFETHRHKRDVTTEPNIAIYQEHPSTQPTPSLNTSLASNRTPIVPPVLDNSTVKITQHLLGVNGSGIQKNISNLPQVSDPIKPDDSDEFNMTSMFNAPDVAKVEANYSNIKEENHTFYNSSFIKDVDIFNKHWNNITSDKGEIHDVLSDSHRRATTLKLKFDFPFYGHPLKNITVATGGFVYTGEHFHSWLAATQYIAPLMANFDTTLTNDSVVKLFDDGTKFTALWENVTLKEDKSNKIFTFAVTLYKNGDIVFAYKDIPISITKINDKDHPVKVGISDAYLTDKILFYVRRKTIYEYHRVSFTSYEITNRTLLKLTAAPTCLEYKSCDTCTRHKTVFNCTWCPQVQRCSSGMDRYKQDWTLRNCDKTKIQNASSCEAIETSTTSDQSATYLIDQKDPYHQTYVHTDETPLASEAGKSEHSAVSDSLGAGEAHQAHSSIGGAVAAFLVVMLISSFAAWVLYAFKYPHTRSGQFLIKYRPSQWSWRRGEARYTAATIHM